MTVNDLLEVLQQYAECEFGDQPVKLLMQPSYPFIYSIGKVGVVSGSNVSESAVYICEGSQEGYGFSFDEVE